MTRKLLEETRVLAVQSIFFKIAGSNEMESLLTPEYLSVWEMMSVILVASDGWIPQLHSNSVWGSHLGGSSSRGTGGVLVLVPN